MSARDLINKVKTELAATAQNQKNGFEQSPRASREDPARKDNNLILLELLCHYLGRPTNREALTAGVPLENQQLALSAVPRAAQRAGVDIHFSKVRFKNLASQSMPALIVLGEERCWLLIAVEGDRAKVICPELGNEINDIEFARLKETYSGTCGLVSALPNRDQRADDLVVPAKKHWFWSEVFREKRNLMEVAFAAAVANFLAIVTSLFAMQVYDRVVPNLAFATLWVLAAGVVLAVCLEVSLRLARGQLMDAVGQRLDLKLSSTIFSRALSIRMENRPKSTGSFSNQVREFDSVRDFFTSTTIGALSDIPFIFFFVALIALIGGPVVWVLLAAIPTIVIFGLLMQRPLAELSQRHMKEGAIRNGLLFEALSNPETVKSLGLENKFQHTWEGYSKILSQNSVRMRGLANLLSFGTTGVQQLVSVFVIVAGVYQIAQGNMTVGGLIACSILASRTVAPLAQLAAIFGRWQQMRSALRGIEAIMDAPVDRPDNRTFLHRPRLVGDYTLENVQFSHDEVSNPAIDKISMRLEAGSGIAILGGNGSGKSTLLRMLAGLCHASEGRVLLDGADIKQIDVGDLRKNIGYLPQAPALFFGTLRENLLAGLAPVDDEVLLEALAFSGGANLVRNHPLGLDRQISEGGGGISGGQRQSVGLARIWLRDPRIVILDEPTSALDTTTEALVLSNMKPWLEKRTLILATHRRSLLNLTDSAFVLRDGQIVVSGETGSVVNSLKGHQERAA